MREPTGGTSRPKPRYSTQGATTAKPKAMPKIGVLPVTGRTPVKPRPKPVDPRAERGKIQTGPAKALIDYYRKNPAEAAKQYIDMVQSGTSFGATDVARGIRERDAVGTGLALAGSIPVLGVPGKVAGAAGKVAKAVKGATTIADAIGPEKAAAVRKAAGAAPAAKPKAVRVPKTKPVEPKTKAAKDRYWNVTVPAWNKANPKNTIKVPTQAPPVGKAATATRAEMATSEAGKSAAETATITAGRKASAAASGKARGARVRAAKAADPNTPKAPRKRSKTTPLPTSSKPPVKAVEGMNPTLRKAAEARTKSLAEDGPSRADLGVKGRAPSAAKSTDARVANMEQRLADVRAARNRGDLPSYEAQEVIGVAVPRGGMRGDLPRAAVKTPKQVTREGTDTERKTRGGMSRVDQAAKAADVKSGGKQGKMPASGQELTKTQIAKYKKQYDPNGPSPLTKGASLAKYPAEVREYLLQARNANAGTRAARSERATKDLMNDQHRNPGVGKRAPGATTKRIDWRSDKEPMRPETDADLRAKNPRPGTGKGSQTKDKPGPNVGTGSSKPTARGPVTDPVIARLQRMESNQARLSTGQPGTYKSDGAVKGTGRELHGGPNKPGSGDKDYRANSPDPLNNTPEGRYGGVRVTDSSTRPKATAVKAAEETPKKATAKKPAAKKSTPKKDAPKRPKSVSKAPAWTKWDEEIVVKPNARDRVMQSRLDAVLGDKKPKAPAAPAAKKTAAPKKPAAKKAAATPKPAAEPKAPAAKKAASKPAVKKPAAKKAAAKKAPATPKKPVNEQASEILNKKPISLTERRAAKAAKAEERRQANPVAGMASDVLKGKGARKFGSKAAAAAIVAAGGAMAYGASKQTGGQQAAEAKPKPKVPAGAAPEGKSAATSKPVRKKVQTDKDGDKFVTDRYGRRISPAEYKRRLAEKKARDAATTPEAKLRLYKQQVARRQKYRTSGSTTSKFGKRATKVTAKPSTRVGDMLRKAAKN